MLGISLSLRREVLARVAAAVEIAVSAGRVLFVRRLSLSLSLSLSLWVAAMSLGTAERRIHY